MDKAFMSVTEVADYLNVKTSTIYSRADEIPHYRVGRLLRFKKQDVDAWMDAQRRESESICRDRPRRTKSVDNSSIDRIVKAAIDEVKRQPYTSYGKSGLIESLVGKED